jgi:membrane protein
MPRRLTGNRRSVNTTARTGDHQRFERHGNGDQRTDPEGPSDLGGGGWRGALRRTVKGVQQDNLTDWAAALTYYAIQALFPALLVLISIVGLLGKSTTNALIANISSATPGPAKAIFTNAIHNLQSNRGAAGVLAIVGVLAALWSASSYISAFSRASNAIYEVPEGRPFWKLRPQQMAIAFVMIVLLSISALAVVITGGLAQQVGNVFGVGSTAVTVWDISKWPVLLLVVSLMFAILYWAAPNVRQPKFRWLSPGGIFGVVVWVIASAAFALYVANFSSYNKTYGALGGVIAFLVWLWISNLAVLLGAELNAELTRSKELAAGRGSLDDEQPILPPRDTTKIKD